MIRKILLAMISGLMLCACGGGAKTDAPESTAKELSLVGDWKEDTDNSSYFYAIIAGNTIEIYIESEDTRSLYWAGNYDEPAEPTDSYSWVSENDVSKTGSSILASGDDTKEFTYENGTLSFYSKIMDVEATRKLKKVSDTPSVDNMKSTITVSQAELKQPELLEVGGSFGRNSNYYHYAAVVRNPNENMGIEFCNYKVVVKGADGTIMAVHDGVAGHIRPGETTIIESMVDCSGGAVETIDFTLSCDRDDFVQNLSGIDSRDFYFKSLTYVDKGKSVYDKSITGILINNTKMKSEFGWITVLYRKGGNIVGAESMSLSDIQPGENIFQFDRNFDCGDFDTIEFYAKGDYGYDNEIVAGFVPQENPVNENVLYVTENGMTNVKPSAAETSAEPAESPDASPAAIEKPSASGEMSLEEFKSKMDSYEEFFNSYAEFMKSYDSSNTEMLGKYTEMLGKYNEAMAALDEIDEASLTTEQKAYYTEVMLRINKTLMEAATSMQG